jgi:hypothetical protein
MEYYDNFLHQDCLKNPSAKTDNKVKKLPALKDNLSRRAGGRRAIAINRHSAPWQFSGTKTDLYPMTLASGFGQGFRRETPAFDQLGTRTAKTRAPAERGKLCFALMLPSVGQCLRLITASEAKDRKIRILNAGLRSQRNVF